MDPLPYTEKLHIDCEETGPVLKPFWEAIGFDRFHEIALPEVQSCWDEIKKHRLFSWLRCHEIFRRDELQRPDWRNFEDQKTCLDIILDAGVRPVLELSRIPDELTNPDHPRGFGGDIEGWQNLVRTFLKFLVDTYGLAEIRTWYFEFWNEPDHHMWAGDQPLAQRERSSRQQIRDYLEMYDRTAAAVMEVCPELHYGGPAISGNTVFLREFLRHCIAGRNAVDGTPGSRMNFVSFHCYSNSTDRHPAMENMLGRIAELTEQVTRAVEGRDVPLIMDEWGATWGGGRTVDMGYPVEHRNSLRAASFTLKLIKELIRYDLDMALYWGFSEHTWYNKNSMHDFNGMRALWTYSGLPRPAVGAYRLLKRLFPQTVRVHRLVDTNNVDALATFAGDELRAMVWHHDPDPLDTGLVSTGEIIIDRLPEEHTTARITLEGYTREHNTYSEWIARGRPDTPEGADRQAILDKAEPTMVWRKEVPIESRAVTTGEFPIRPGEFFLLTMELS